ncbi:MAG: hypothetical protein MUF28_02830 [Ignavibacterium sp.]|jgi:hypothetical protein|nr:hypothetical protein [Ignavibacterium sp.]
MKIRIAYIFLLLSFYAYPQTDDYSIGGYAKYLFSSVKYPDLDERYYDNLIHTRLNTKWYPFSVLTATMELRFRTYFGGSVKNYSNFENLIKSYQPLIDLDAVLWSSTSSIGYLEADRLYLDYYTGNLQTTVGRQRIAWGTSWVWNPTDIFNPQSVLDFDHEELPGVDALRLQYYTGAVSKIEVALAPAREKEFSSYGLLFSQNALDYDFNFMGGLKRERWILGTSWSGDILDAGFRGEITYSQNPKKINEYDSLYSYFGEEAISANKNNVFSFVLSGDYTFPNSFYIHTELLFNSNGKTENVRLFYDEAYQLGMLSAARWSLYQEFSYDITPLLRGSVFAIMNPDDKSFVLVPSVSYSIITNFDVYLIGLFFNGDHLTEYGDYGHYFYARLKWSF